MTDESTPDGASDRAANPATNGAPGGPSGSRHAGSRRPAPRWFFVVPAAALLVGLLLGGLVVGVALDRPPTGAGGGSPVPEGAPGATGSADPSASPDTVAVPLECLEAAESVQEATSLIRDGATAIREFRPQELLDLLDELEDLDQQAREQAAACQDIELTASPTPEPPDE